MYKRIVAGTDLSKTARFATDRAAALAKGLGAELILVHAGEDPGEPFQKLGQAYGASTVATPGNPAEVLLTECERVDADLLVVGSVGMSGARRFLLGSVPNQVSHHASRDLLIVKTDPPPRDVGEYRNILVGTDGSPTATHAVEKIATLAAKLGITPTIVCAYEPLTDHELEQLRADPGDPVAQWKADKTTRGTPDEFRWRLADAAQADDVLERAADHATKQGVTPEVRAVQGNAADVLISLAQDEGFDVLAVGSVGMSGPRRFMLGNVPHRVSHHAPTDVLILHTT
jgi:nucleotide-binding universal stress UspA family protein